MDEDKENALDKFINSMLTKKQIKDLLDGKVNFLMESIMLVYVDFFLVATRNWLKQKLVFLIGVTLKNLHSPVESTLIIIFDTIKTI